MALKYDFRGPWFYVVVIWLVTNCLMQSIAYGDVKGDIQSIPEQDALIMWESYKEIFAYHEPSYGVYGSFLNPNAKEILIATGPYNGNPQRAAFLLRCEDKRWVFILRVSI